MIQRKLGERFCVWWWGNAPYTSQPENGEEWVQHLAVLLGWPVLIETENVEVWNGGGA